MNTINIKIEGGLFSADLIDQIADGEALGQKPADFNLDGRRRLTEEIADLFGEARRHWEAFKHRLDRIPETDPATSVTRDQWAIPLLSLLGYEQLAYQARAAEVDGQTFAISHRAGVDDAAPPVHIVGCRQSLDHRPESGRPRLAPHSLLQEYLNRTEHLWAIVTNGYILRLLRDSQLISRLAYIELDLRQMMEGEKFADFALLYRLVHRTRLPRSIDDAKDCWLERYYKLTIEQGGRVRDKLRDGVEEALKIFAHGFLRHPRNQSLREIVRGGELSPVEFYQQLLRLIYRLLFLMVAEERNLISENPVYREHYSIARLRRLAEGRSAYSEHEDLWLGLQTTLHLFQDEKLGKPLGVPALNGDLFEAPGKPNLSEYCLTNRNLLTSLWHLSMYRETERTPWRRINYAALGVEELGSVYESLLDFQPIFIERNGAVAFDLASGTERKSTGSYYTPPELVSELVQSALVPVIQERLKMAKPKQEKEQALRSLKVCDPACGSGHFLLAAARRLGRDLAKIRTGDDEPSPEEIRLAIREVITHCIYGVDKNPLAVDLCKVALWIEGHAKGKPLTFLDHRIRCGDSLIGVLDLNALKDGIPDEAFEPVAGDDKAIARSLKRQNRDERRGQQVLPFEAMRELRILTDAHRMLLELSDDTPEQIRRKTEAYQKIQSRGTKWWQDSTACHLWTAAFFAQLTKTNHANHRVPTTDDLNRYLENPNAAYGPLIGNVWALAERHRFFHWPLEFPEVFAGSRELGMGNRESAVGGREGSPDSPLPIPHSPSSPGFDVVLSNPPWERIKLQEQEFFATRDSDIALAPNKAARERLIRQLPERNPELWREYQQALHTADALSKFLRQSNRCPLTARGDINTYAVFAELARQLLNLSGRAGIIVPTGIATDDTCKQFFADLNEKRCIVSLFDFENREALFPGVHRNYKFCLLTMSGRPIERSDFAFFLTHTDQLHDEPRRFTLAPADLALLNPNTRTCPIFRTGVDAELTKKIYRRVPVLVNEQTGENPWGVSFLRMLDMANDSGLFKTAAGDGLLPLYEAKFINQFDHRHGTCLTPESIRANQADLVTEEEHANPHFLVRPRYWVPQAEVEARLAGWPRGWLIGFRDVTRAVDLRTCWFSLLPRVGVGHKIPLVFLGNAPDTPHIACFLADVNSFVLDYVARQKIGGISLSYFILNQLPILPPSAYTPADIAFIAPRVLELVYTAWDIKPFADDVWRGLGESGMGNGEWGMRIRKEIIRRWEETYGKSLAEVLSGPGCLERSHDAGRDVLSPDKELPQRGALWDDQSDSAGRSFSSGEHSRRVWPGESWGIHSILEDLARFAQRAGDASAAGDSGRVDHTGSGEVGAPAVRQGGQDFAGLDSLLAKLVPTPDSPLPIPPFRWDENRRAQLRAELDAYYARLYGLTRDELRYILDPADVYGEDFPGETFRVLKEKELRQYGEYRTRRLVLAAWDELPLK